MLGIKPGAWALGMLDKCSTNEIHIQPYFMSLWLCHKGVLCI